ncbi:arrestin domain-containing protein 3 [Amia ocellicauda]|uniref:arrestin domain-containing protein 3 n=1 Tax=Amia ocellicauda TaxID=2972642 RepID=UPI003464C7F2
MFKGTVTNLSISYDALNESNTFSRGDVISGRVTFDVSKEIKVEYLTVSAKGKASVHWTESHGEDSESYNAEEKYFKLENTLIQQNSEQNNLQPGTHVYSFTFQIPMIELPPSFEGMYGKVVYQLEAKLRRPWHLSKRSVKEFTVINPVNIQSPELLAPQMASKNKTVCCLCCASGPISLSARIERRAYTPGESIRIFAEIENGSTRTIRPKAYIQQKQTFYAEGNEMFYVKKIVSVEGEPFFSGKTGTWSGELPKIPLDTSFSIQNCQILKVEYLVVVYVEIPCAVNLSVEFPVMISSFPMDLPMYM